MARKHVYLVNRGAWLGVWTRALLCAWVWEGCQDACTWSWKERCSDLGMGTAHMISSRRCLGSECSSWLELVGWIFLVHLGFLAHEMNKKHTVLVMLKLLLHVWSTSLLIFIFCKYSEFYSLVFECYITVQVAWEVLNFLGYWINIESIEQDVFCESNALST